MSYMKELAKAAGNEYGSLVDNGIFGGDVSQYIDTGSYVFNALLSGSIYGGLPANKITALAGESATGKTFFTLGLVKHFLDMNPTGGCIYFESESALTSEMLKERGIDTTRVYHMPVATVEEFRHQAVKILEKHDIFCWQKFRKFRKMVFFMRFEFSSISTPDRPACRVSALYDVIGSMVPGIL